MTQETANLIEFLFEPTNLPWNPALAKQSFYSATKIIVYDSKGQPWQKTEAKHAYYCPNEHKYPKGFGPRKPKP